MQTLVHEGPADRLGERLVGGVKGIVAHPLAARSSVSAPMPTDATTMVTHTCALSVPQVSSFRRDESDGDRLDR